MTSTHVPFITHRMTASMDDCASYGVVEGARTDVCRREVQEDKSSGAESGSPKQSRIVTNLELKGRRTCGAMHKTCICDV